ncbi:hypothetical protein ACTXT7_013458 [Hymenolepis weldensis]
MILYIFPEFLFTRILYDNTSVFRPRGRSDIALGCQSPAPTLPSHLLSSSALPPLSLSLSLTGFNPRCGSSEYSLVQSTLAVLLLYRY